MDKTESTKNVSINDDDGDDGEICLDCAYLEKQYYQDSNKPASVFILGSKNFIKQSKGIAEQLLANIGVVSEKYVPPEERLPLCLGLTLSNEAVKEAERRREARDGRVDTNAVARALYDVGCFVLDELFDKRPIARFWFLETIARIPYFSYVSMLHLYESFGWWRGIELRKIHNAEGRFSGRQHFLAELSCRIFLA
jgi:ubiquinol oxidase